jgi:hypothetical protein
MGSLFGKLFAPGRWDSSDAERTTTCRVSLADDQIAANATTINVKKTDSFDEFPSSGTCYIGTCAVTYTGVTTTSTTNTGGYPDETLGQLTGCVVGEYCAISEPRGTNTTAMGCTIKHPVHEDWTATEVGRGHVVSTVPYTWLGKRVALYVTTWDEATGAWNSVDDAQRVWAGRLSDAIQFDPRRRVWRLSCESMASDLDQQIMASSPTAHVCGINLNSEGDWGRTWWVVEFAAGLPVSQIKCTVSAGVYTAAGLARDMCDAMNDWSAWSGAAHAESFWCNLYEEHGEYEFSINSGATGHQWIILPHAGVTDPFAPNNVCHCWNALGFGFDVWTMDGSATGDATKTGGKFYYHYHPLDLRYNGHKMYVLEQGTDRLWSTQGDYGATLAYVHAKKVKVDGKEDGPYIAAYTARTAAQPVYWSPASPVVQWTTTTLTLAGEYLQPPQSGITPNGFLGGSEFDTAYPEVSNGYVPTWRGSDGRLRGPFEALLYSLCSTGTTGYNSAAYDKLPVELSIGMPIALVDTGTFLAADRELLTCYPSLALRRFYPITKAISWRELFEREAKLFGYALTFKAGQWTVINYMHPALESIDVTLDDGNTAYSDDWPVIDMSMDTTINQWAFRLDYDWTTDKYRTTVNIRDEESFGAQRVARVREVEHPGVLPQKSDYATRSLVQIKVQDEMFMLRRPWQVVRRTLSPDLLGLIAVGDVVNYHVDTATHPDPMGSGGMTCDAVAIVSGLRWNFAKCTGSVTLIICGQDESRMTPWCPAAVVDFGAAGGGWVSGDKTLTLLEWEFADGPADGVMFVAGDKLLLFERAPADPTSLTLTPKVLTAVSYTALTRALVVEEDAIAGFDDSGETEYVIVYADYATAIAAQIARGTWQAAQGTHLLNAADRAKAFG